MGYARRQEATNAITLEILALLRGLQLAVHHHLTPLEININVQEVIIMLRNPSIVYSHMLNDCKFLIHQLNDPAVIHTYKEQNQVADRLAHFG